MVRPFDTGREEWNANRRRDPAPNMRGVEETGYDYLARAEKLRSRRADFNNFSHDPAIAWGENL